MLNAAELDALCRNSEEDAARLDAAFYLKRPSLDDMDNAGDVFFGARNDDDALMGLAHLTPAQIRTFDGSELISCVQNERELVLQIIETFDEFRNQGAAKTMLRACFAHAASEGKTLNLGDFTTFGDLYLKSVVREGLENYPGLLTHEMDEFETFEEWLDNDMDGVTAPHL